ncbi:extracellular solute-binding protein [Streptomyces zagrosensis]|uniref:Raffinose/stachyose/melibiose transport system substrate-binding protein n=1 Tax=Streptomyces zagrosensis TaxID=1042984 RepID=A0A7W9QHH7_9ACTN|nr:extracellular solute-binding protein [Streptomyces zagrosensis]MBB5940370.1 raffinose/stachyose/melibiose transport system substrate-binding protein [Streptomyces zagrosensis]
MHKRGERGRRRRGRVVATVLGCLTLLATGCVPGTDGPGARGGTAGAATAIPDPAKAGKVTLTVWDQEIRGGTNGEVKQLNKEFQRAYPNVRIKRVARGFTDLKATLKLAVSGNNPPDVIQTNQGYPDMVAFVRAGLLAPLDNYAGIYDWNTRYPATLLDLNRVSADGHNFGTGRLYGISQTGEFVGLYYNKDLLAKSGLKPPTTWAEFTNGLARIKQDDRLPIQFGNLDKYPAIHTFGVLQNQSAAGPVRDAVLGRAGRFDDERTKNAAATLADWHRRGYLPEGTNGLGYDDAAKKFASGDGAYLLTGTWQLADLKKAMGDKLGFIPPPPATAGGAPVSTGGQGLAWSITSRTKHPEVAAAYLDFLTTEHASDVMTQHGVLPAVPGKAAAKVPRDSVDGQMLDGWQRLNEADGLVPYLDYATPTFYDTLSEQLQGVIAGTVSPARFAATAQRDYGAFMRTQQQDDRDRTGKARGARGERRDGR